MARRFWRTAAILLSAMLIAAACVPEGADGDDVAADDPDPAAEPEADDPEAEEPETEAAEDDDGHLDFTIWTFDAEGVQGYIDEWEANVEGDVGATLSDTDWGQYHDAMVAQFVAGDMPDVMWVSDHWLHEWAGAGWLVPVTEVVPDEELDALREDMLDFAVSGMSVDGELYGLPYYADPIGFTYNSRHYEEAGIEGPPETWEDVLDDARAIKEAGIVQYPIGFGWSQDEPFSIEDVTAMLMARGDEFFDDNLDPTFTEEGSTLHEHIEWVQTAFEEDLIDPESLQRDGVVNGQAMMAGTQTYTLGRASGMAQWQSPEESAEAGNFELAVMPGETGETLGFVRFYGVTSRVPERGEQARDAAASFLDYFGGPGPEGDYPVVRQWVERWGLGFGYESLFDDPDIREQFSEWVDVDTLEQVATTARARRLSEWYPEWDVFTRAELQRAYLGETTADEAAQRIAEQWETLREEFGG